MPFQLPVFNLNVDIYTGPWLTKTLRVSVLGNLAFSRRVVLASGGEDPTSAFTVTTCLMQLLLPPLTDVRDRYQGGSYDVVEVPSGSGRWYAVFGVDDIGKGFGNEHRCAWLQKIGQNLNASAFPGLNWPVPMT